VGRAVLFASIAAVSACALFPSLDGLGGQDASSPPNDASHDPTELPDTTPPESGGDTSVADVVTGPLYERVVTIVNGGSTPLPVGYTIGVPFPASQIQAAVSAGKMRADLADLGVKGPSGERDRLIDASPFPSVVWFSLSAQIAGGATDTSYAITYGDPNASSPPANGAAVFAFYDDFVGTSLDGSKWMSQGTVSVSGGELTLPKGGLGAVTTLSLPATTTVEWRAKISDPTSDPDGQTGFYYWFGFQRNGDFVTTDPWILWIARDESLVGAEDDADGCPNDCANTPGAQNNGFRNYGIERQPLETIFSIDNATSYSTPATNDQAMSLMIRNFLVTSDVVVDWMRARTRNYPEPTVSLGPEQQL